MERKTTTTTKTKVTRNSSKREPKSACCSATSKASASTKNCGGKCTKKNTSTQTRNSRGSKQTVKSCS